MNQHHRQHWLHSDDTSHGAVGPSEFILLWIAFLLLDAVLWLLFYRLGEWAWQWV
jgi:hypothetical protein